MNREEFIKECSQRGYCTKKVSNRFTVLYPKDEYTEEDLEEAYRYAERVLSQSDLRAGLHFKTSQNGTGFKSTKEYYSIDD